MARPLLTSRRPATVFNPRSWTPLARAMVVTGACVLGTAAAAERCPERDGDQSPTDSSRVESDVGRVFRGYKNQDIRAVASSLCDLDAAIPLLGETLTAEQVARIHLAQAVGAQMRGADQLETRSYLKATMGPEPYPDLTLSQDQVQLLLGEGDPLATEYRELAQSTVAAAMEPERWARRAKRTEDPNSAASFVLPPPWRGELMVDGKKGELVFNDPFLVQVVDRKENAASFYVEPSLSAGGLTLGETGARTVPYTRERPRIAALALGTGLASMGAMAVAFRSHQNGQPTSLPLRGSRGLGSTVSGDALLAAQATRQLDYDQKRILNNVSVGVGGLLGAVSTGLSAYYVWTFR